MQKKILIFSFAYYPKHVGGAEVAINEITDRISQEDIVFHMVTNRFDATLPKIEQVGNVLVHRIGIVSKNPSMADLRKFPLHLNKILFQFLAAWHAWRLHRIYHYDGIWAMMAHACGVPAGIFKTCTNIPYVLTLQEGDPPEYIENKMRIFGTLFKRAFTKADRVQTISTFLVAWARHMGFSGPLKIIPNAVNTAHFSQTYTAKELVGAKKEIGKKEGEIYMVTTSRLVKKNGLGDVISSLPFLDTHIKFLIFGTGPDEQKLRELAHNLGVTDRVIFWGQIDHAVMPKYLKACDIFIRPSLSEGMGNSFVEAFAAELPVIATQEGGIADFLFDEKRNPDKPTTGWAVNAQSPQQIANAVQTIVAHPEKTKQVVANAKQLAFTKYDWNRIAQDMYAKVFTPLLTNHIKR